MAKKTVSRPKIATGPRQTYAPRVFFVTDNFVNVIVKKIKHTRVVEDSLLSCLCGQNFQTTLPCRLYYLVVVEYHLSSQTILHNTTSNKGKKSTNKP